MGLMKLCLFWDFIKVCELITLITSQSNVVHEILLFHETHALKN
jgi:hypothetical protein